MHREMLNTLDKKEKREKREREREREEIDSL